MGSTVSVVDATTYTSLMDGLYWQVVKYIAASMKWLKENDWSNIFFFCKGGALSIANDVLFPEVDSVVAFYGVTSPQLASPSSTKAPVHAHFGELDDFVAFSNVTTAKSLENLKVHACIFDF
jgi:carboxymethylenebutenolidase